MLTLPQELSIDSLSYVYSVRENSQLFHPHHLIYNTSARLFWLITKTVFPNTNPIIGVQVHNVVFTIFLGLVSMQIFRKIGLSKIWNLMMGMLLIMTHSIWKMTGCCEVYIPSLFFGALVIYLLYRRPNSCQSISNCIGYPVLLTLSILYHQLGVFTCLAILIMGWLNNGLKGFLNHLVMILLAGLFASIAYVIVIHSIYHDSSFGTIKKFIFHYSYSGVEEWGNVSNFSVKGLLKLIRSFTYGFFNGKLAGVALYQVLTILLIALVILLSIKNKLPIKEVQSIKVGMLLWGFVYLLFIWWWLPGEGEFFVTPVWIIFILAATILAQKNNSRLHKFFKVFWVGFLGVMLIINLPYELSAHHTPWQLKEKVIQNYHSFPNDALIIDDHFETEISRFYLHREVINVNILFKNVYNGDLPAIMRYQPMSKVVPIKFLDPDFVSKDYDYNTPKEAWQNMLFWLINYRQIPEERTTFESLSFELVQVTSEYYFFIHPPYRQDSMLIPDLKNLFKGVDDKIYQEL